MDKLPFPLPHRPGAERPRVWPGGDEELPERDARVQIRHERQNCHRQARQGRGVRRGEEVSDARKDARHSVICRMRFNILTLTGKRVFFFLLLLLCFCLLAPCLYSVWSCCFVQDLTFDFSFLLDASLLSFPLFSFFYVLFLSDLGGGRYCTDKRPHPLPFPHLHPRTPTCLV